MSKNKLKIAIAGVGTVGKGLLNLLDKYKSNNVEVSAIASRKKIKLKSKIFKNTIFFKDAKDLLSFDDFDVLVELIGGDSGISKEIVFEALKKRKNVVTANKALVSKYWKHFQSLALSNKCTIKFEAAVAGGIPIIKVIDEFLVTNKIRRIYGILNGTCNYILSNMLSSSKEFNLILNDAKRLGYAESDPTFDIDGTDTSHKLSILSSLAFNCNVCEIRNEGIQKINLLDLRIADSLGYKIKLIGLTEFEKNSLKCFVYPCLLSKDSFIAKIDGVYNGIVVESDFCKKTCFVGEGAGAFPTATSVLSDVLSLTYSEPGSIKRATPSSKHRIESLEERLGSYYLRFTTDDKPGVISGIANEFKKNNISMNSMLQKETGKSNAREASIVITTHNCLEKNMMNALDRINSLSFIRKRTVYLRIENFK